MSNELQTNMVTGVVRLSYANVWEPKAMNQGDREKYSTAILIDKKDKATVKAIENCIEAAKQAGKAKWNGKIPATLKLPLRDGDEEKPDDENYAGMYFLNASSTTPPQIVDKRVQPILDRDEVYSGVFAKVSLNFYPFNTNGNRGVAVGLGNIQKIKDGDRLAGGTTAAQDFGVIDDDDFEEADDLD